MAISAIEILIQALQLLIIRGSPIAASAALDEAELFAQHARFLDRRHINAQAARRIGCLEDEPDPDQIIACRRPADPAFSAAADVIHESLGRELQDVNLPNRVPLQELQCGLLSSLATERSTRSCRCTNG